MLKRTIPAFILVTILAGMLLAGTVIQNLTALSDGNDVLLQWRTGSEVNLLEFQVERSADGIEYFRIGAIKPKGSFSDYRYVDKTIFAKVTGRTYSYRIKIIDRDETFRYSSVVTVSPQVSGVRETWGSIKAMFR